MNVLSNYLCIISHINSCCARWRKSTSLEPITLLKLSIALLTPRQSWNLCRIRRSLSSITLRESAKIALFFKYFELQLLWNKSKQIKIGVLVVRQTHENIKQAFCTTTCRHSSKDGITLADCRGMLQKTFEEVSEVTHLKIIKNWSGLRKTRKQLTCTPAFSHVWYVSFASKGTTILKRCWQWFNG